MMASTTTDWPLNKLTSKWKQRMLMPSMPSKLETHSTMDTFSCYMTPENNSSREDIQTQFSSFTLLVAGLKMMMHLLTLESNNIKLFLMMEHSIQNIPFLPYGHHQCTMVAQLKLCGTHFQELNAALPTSSQAETQPVWSTQKTPTKTSTMCGTVKSSLFMSTRWSMECRCSPSKWLLSTKLTKEWNSCSQNPTMLTLTSSLEPEWEPWLRRTKTHPKASWARKVGKYWLPTTEVWKSQVNENINEFYLSFYF